jgi:hypothetical protein
MGIGIGGIGNDLSGMMASTWLQTIESFKAIPMPAD